MSDTQAAREKLVDDFLAVIADSEELLEALVASGSDKAEALRSDLDQKLQDARERLGKLQKDAVDGSRAIAQQTDKYVRANPWQSVAIGAGAGLVAGLVIGMLISRD